MYTFNNADLDNVFRDDNFKTVVTFYMLGTEFEPVASDSQHSLYAFKMCYRSMALQEFYLTTYMNVWSIADKHGGPTARCIVNHLSGKVFLDLYLSLLLKEPAHGCDLFDTVKDGLKNGNLDVTYGRYFYTRDGGKSLYLIKDTAQGNYMIVRVDESEYKVATYSEAGYTVYKYIPEIWSSIHNTVNLLDVLAGGECV